MKLLWLVIKNFERFKTSSWSLLLWTLFKVYYKSFYRLFVQWFCFVCLQFYLLKLNWFFFLFLCFPTEYSFFLEFIETGAHGKKDFCHNFQPSPSNFSSRNPLLFLDATFFFSFFFFSQRFLRLYFWPGCFFLLSVLVAIYHILS